MAITLDGTLGVTAPTYAGTVTAEYLVPVTAFKNRILNGAMMIDQRNAGASVTPTATTYTLDRWQAYNGGVASKFSVQRNAGSVTHPSGFINYLGATSTSAYSVAASDRFGINQTIEGLNASDLGWGTANASTVTLSFWVRSSLTGTFGGSIQNYAATRSYPYSFAISSANTWEYKTITIVGDTSGTWVTTNEGFATINFSLGTGTDRLGTAGAWASSDFRAPTGATSVVGTNGATFYITGVQLEKGSTATSFDYRPYGQELQLCQRYYEKSYAQNVVPGTVTDDGRLISICGTVSSGGVIAVSVPFAVEKRAAPTMSSWDANGNIGRITTFSANGTPTQNVTPNIGFGETSTRTTRLAQTGNIAGIACQWVASIEL